VTRWPELLQELYQVVDDADATADEQQKHQGLDHQHGVAPSSARALMMASRRSSGLVNPGAFGNYLSRRRWVF
jgi:hypothetical protein